MSTLLPVIGPAVAQLPARSQIAREPVDEFAVSVPAATVVESEKFASPLLASPETPSFDVHERLTSPACHAPSAAAQLEVGAVWSSEAVKLPVAQFPAASQLDALVYETFAPSVKATVSGGVGTLGSSGSLVVQWIVTGERYQPLADDDLIRRRNAPGRECPDVERPRRAQDADGEHG